MTPENLSRAFSALKPYGVVVDGTDIRLSKLADLKTLAKPTPLIDNRDV
jgi:CRP/FNR family transcriptional activator FtrB